MRERDEHQVAELPGEYGPVSISELLVQKLWLRGDFRKEELQTRSGEAIRILHPGTWNRLGGPDFKGAELEIGGVRHFGDIEMHFYQRDWKLHGHHENPAFDGVVLHVLVFEPSSGSAAVLTSAGRRLAECVLAPLMSMDLESYAEHDALRQLDERDLLELAAPLLELDLADRRARLREEAMQRWAAKVAFVGARVDAAGWAEACHQLALVTLGYARNRSGMHALAHRISLEAWLHSPPDPEKLAAEDAFEWVRSGLRPANQPRTRLRQYATWVAQVGNWPDRLEQLAGAFELEGSLEETTAAYRRRVRASVVRKRLASEVAGGAVVGTRFDTLLADVLMPLCACRTDPERWAAAWYHWFAGDMPDALNAFLRVAGLHRNPRQWPVSNGSYQGVLRWLVSR